MMMFYCLNILFLIVYQSWGYSLTGRLTSIKGRTEADAVRFLRVYNNEALKLEHDAEVASWAYRTNLTQYNSKVKTYYQQKVGIYESEASIIAAEFPFHTFNDPSVRRQFLLLAETGEGNCTGNDPKRLMELVNEMISIYSNAKICPPAKKDCDMDRDGWTMDEEIPEYLEAIRDYKDLEYVWTKWRDVTGKKIKPLYTEYAKLKKAASRCGNFDSVRDDYLATYQRDLKDQDFSEVLEKNWNEVFPLYEQLHAYVRHKLVQFYGDDYTMAPDEPMPAHILGNMYAQSWSNIMDVVRPYNDVQKYNLTKILEKKNYTVTKIARTAEEFYKSIGFLPMPKSFWKRSMLTRPEDDREVDCHGAASTFFYNNDVRIKMCGTVNEDAYTTLHHEMGHCEYFMYYNVQPAVFRSGANPGFHEAVGDTTILSAKTPKHLKTIGLLDEMDDSEEAQINELMDKALDAFGFLPYSYLVDLWRWQMLNGDFEDHEANSKWWELREKYQGVVPPNVRTSDDFDPASKYHVSANIPYIRYFIARLLQFSFHKSACDASNHPSDQPIHTCDFYNSKKAGDKLKRGLKLGSSLPWPDTLEIMTGSREINPSAILEYFDPLMEFLKKYNEENDVPVGWKTGTYKKMLYVEEQ